MKVHSLPRRTLLVIALQFFCSVGAAAPFQSQTTWVRGRIEWRGSPSNYPARGIKVGVVPYESRDDNSRFKIAYTGDNGIYDFRLARGDYVLRVWIPDKDSKDFLIKVTGDKYLNIGTIVID
jgi:hypothetical protein